MSSLFITLRYISRDNKARRWLLVNAIMAGLVVLMVVVGGYLSSFLSAQQGNLENYQRYEKQAKSELNMVEHYEQYSQRISEAHESLAKKISQPDLVKAIAKMAASSDVTISAQNYRKTEGRKGMEGYLIELSVEGSYANSKRFIEEIGRLRGVAYIERMKMVSSDAATVSLSMRANVYQWGR